MWSYDLINNPTVAQVRLIVADTDAAKPIWSDEEIIAMYAVQRSMFYGGFSGRSRTTAIPVSPLRVAALLLDSLASNRARLASVTKLLDVTLNPGIAAKALHDQAESLRTLDDNSGSFAIAEQATTTWAFQDRWWKQVMRQSGGGI